MNNQKCNICNTSKLQNDNFCKQCGHKFGTNDLDREFRAGKLEALSQFNKYFVGWLAGITIILTFAGFLGISKIQNVYEEELNQISKEKEQLKATYKELETTSKDLTKIIGKDTVEKVSLANLIKVMGINFYTIKDIYIQAKYTYKNKINSKIKPFYNVIDLKKKNSKQHLIEFKSDNDFITQVGTNQIIVRYSPFQMYEYEYKSKNLSFFNNALESVKLRSNYPIQNLVQKQIILNELNNNPIKDVTLDIYVNSILFWSLKINEPRKFEKIEEIHHNTPYEFVKYTKYFDFKKEFNEDINKIIERKFQSSL